MAGLLTAWAGTPRRGPRKGTRGARGRERGGQGERRFFHWRADPADESVLPDGREDLLLAQMRWICHQAQAGRATHLLRDRPIQEVGDPDLAHVLLQRGGVRPVIALAGEPHVL